VLKRFQRKLEITVDSELNDYNMANIIGYVKGTKYPDSFIVISAHYDHLGMLGAYTLFPGANDNASGVAMMLDIMHQVKNKPLEYSVAFMAFAGEEIGLLGSLYYTETPLFPLSDISLLINLDLMGTGDKGMMVVNATLFPKEFQELQLINISKDYLPIISSRGKAANSDHYYFTEKGVKAFFFYLMGEYKYYHDIHDGPEAITLSRYNQAYSLIYDFISGYSAGKY
jgi:aminopeptidase YwaD